MVIQNRIGGNQDGAEKKGSRAEQVEALQALLEYNPRLLHSMKAVTVELEGERKPDTDEFLRAVINGMNWEIQIVNGTKEVISEQEVEIDRQKMNESFRAFSDRFAAKDDYGMARLLFQEIVPFFEIFEQAARNVVEKEQG